MEAKGVVGVEDWCECGVETSRDEEEGGDVVFWGEVGCCTVTDDFGLRFMEFLAFLRGGAGIGALPGQGRGADDGVGKDHDEDVQREGEEGE